MLRRRARHRIAAEQKRATPPEQPPPPPARAGSELYNPKGGDDRALRSAIGKVLGGRVRHPHEVPRWPLAVTGGARRAHQPRRQEPRHRAEEADIELKQQEPPGVETAIFKGDVVLTAADGLEVKSAEATYTECDGIVRIPGAVDFKKDRMSGAGAGATYDRNRDVLWILDKAMIAVAPDASGQGGMDGSAATGRSGPAEHYVEALDGRRGSIGDGRAMQADDITITPDAGQRTRPDDAVARQQPDLRRQGGPQSMVGARHRPDLRGRRPDASDANLIEQAPSAVAGHVRARQARDHRANDQHRHGARRLDRHAPRGQQNVQVDIPAENNAPAKQITVRGAGRERALPTSA